MNKKISLILIMMVIIAGLSFSQGLVGLYEDNINPDLIDTPVKMEKLERDLQEVGKINPVLIYYYLMKINNDSKETELDKQVRFYYFQLFRAWETSFLNEKKVWLEYERDYTKSKYSSIISSEILGYLYDVLDYDEFVYSPKDTLHPNDTTAYIEYLYLTREKSGFDPSRNYKNLIKTVKKREEDRIKTFYNTSWTEENERDAIILAQQNKDLFNVYKPDNISSELRFADYIYKFIKHKYLETSSINLGVSGVIVPYKFGDIFDYQFKDYRYPYLESQNKFTINYTPQLAVTAGYKYRLSELKGMFSYLSGNFSFFIVNGNTEEAEYAKNIPYQEFEYPTREFVGMYTLAIENKSFMAMSAEFETPLYYLSRNLFFVGGAEFNYFSLNFDAKMDREVYTLVSNSEIDFEDFVFESKYKFNKFEVYPFLGVRIEYFSPVSILFRSFRLQQFIASISFNLGME